LEQEEYDQERTGFLEEQGYKVLRFWNNDVLNKIDGVVLAIIGFFRIFREKVQIWGCDGCSAPVTPPNLGTSTPIPRESIIEVLEDNPNEIK